MDPFEEHRAHLRAVALRMLGSASDADDAVQEAWLRLQRSDIGDVRNLRAWLTTVVARICLDVLRAAECGARTHSTTPRHGVEDDGVDRAEQEAVLADSVGAALMVVLQTLSPAERLALVLHDMFDVPFAEIGPIVGRSPNATAQLAARARRRVRGKPPNPGPTLPRSVGSSTRSSPRRVPATSTRYWRLLHPDVELRADAVADRLGRCGGRARGTRRRRPRAHVRNERAVRRTCADRWRHRRRRRARRATGAGAAVRDGRPGDPWHRHSRRPTASGPVRIRDPGLNSPSLAPRGSVRECLAMSFRSAAPPSRSRAPAVARVGPSTSKVSRYARAATARLQPWRARVGPCAICRQCRRTQGRRDATDSRASAPGDLARTAGTRRKFAIPGAARRILIRWNCSPGSGWRPRRGSTPTSRCWRWDCWPGSPIW